MFIHTASYLSGWLNEAQGMTIESLVVIIKADVREER